MPSAIEAMAFTGTRGGNVSRIFDEGQKEVVKYSVGSPPAQKPLEFASFRLP